MSDRILKIESEKEGNIYNMLIVCGPNEGDKKQEKGELSNRLQEETEKSRDILIVIGGVNRRVETSPEDTEGTVGRSREKKRNGDKITNFCILNGLMVPRRVHT